eukprot:2884014-Amphidinium_carterae.1
MSPLDWFQKPAVVAPSWSSAQQHGTHTHTHTLVERAWDGCDTTVLPRGSLLARTSSHALMEKGTKRTVTHVIL